MPENLGLRKFSRFYTLWAIKSHSGFFSKPAIDPVPLPESRRLIGSANFLGL